MWVTWAALALAGEETPVRPREVFSRENTTLPEPRSPVVSRRSTVELVQRELHLLLPRAPDPEFERLPWRGAMRPTPWWSSGAGS